MRSAEAPLMVVLEQAESPLMVVHDRPDAESQAGSPAGVRAGYRRALYLTTAIAVSLLAVSAIVFTISAGNRRITSHAETVHVADETMRVATVARAQLGFANHLAAVQRELGTDVTEPREQSSRQATVALDELTLGITRLVQAEALTEPGLVSAVSEFTAMGYDILEMITDGRSLEADQLVATRLQGTYETMFNQLETVRDDQIATLKSSDALVAKLGDLARFLIAFLIPLAVIIVYREIVRRQQRQAELEMRLQAEREIGAARDDFVANASHEFRTPLTGIYGLSQLIEEDPDSSEATREFAAIISTEASDLTRMVEDLLTTARLESGALTYHPEDVVTDEEATDVLRPFNRSHTAVVADVAPAVVRVDRLRQRQMLRNLVSNALKYGGPEVSVVGTKDTTTYQWVVRDNGDGVPEELAPNLFQRFVHRGTTVVVPGGVGLGLSIVRALAEGMGGSVSYRRRDGWSEFVVEVPLARPHYDYRSGPSAAHGSASGLQVAATSAPTASGDQGA